MSRTIDHYRGTGAKREGPPPLFDGGFDEDPKHYVAEPGLADAVNVALLLGQPLLVTGEAGCGKTRLAGSIAHELGLRFDETLEFRTRSSSTYQDLLYRYESLDHFHDAQLRREPKAAEEYVVFGPLGEAIRWGDPEEAKRRGRDQERCLVLIDEIDKAPRDLPNDLLNEIERMTFRVRETKTTYTADKQYRPFAVLTSNVEKDLPDAFRRRCVFYHLKFPDVGRLADIVRRRLPGSAYSDKALGNAIRHFSDIREKGLEKKPSTAELLAWVAVLAARGLDVGDDPAKLAGPDRDKLRASYTALAKGQADLAALRGESGEETR